MQTHTTHRTYTHSHTHIYAHTHTHTHTHTFAHTYEVNHTFESKDIHTYALTHVAVIRFSSQRTTRLARISTAFESLSPWQPRRRPTQGWHSPSITVTLWRRWVRYFLVTWHHELLLGTCPLQLVCVFWRCTSLYFVHKLVMRFACETHVDTELLVVSFCCFIFCCSLMRW